MKKGWNEDRWKPAGTNSAGDPMYARDLSAGDKSVPSEDLSKEELKALAESKGLPTSGTKADLLERLAG